MINTNMKKKNYLNNKDILVEIVISNNQGKMSDNLAKMFLLLVNKIGSKPNFTGYSYIDEMKGDALLNLVMRWDRFDCEIYKNPFAYFTQFVFRSFLQYIKKEGRQQDIRDAMRVYSGYYTSHKYQDSAKDSLVLD